MNRITSLITTDKEFENFISTLESAYRREPLPIAVNGLSGGAEIAFLCESVISARKISGAPVLVLVESESAREKIASSLSDSGLSVKCYKKRDLVFHNIRASHDIDRERLSVLSAVMAGECDAVVTTPSAAALRTLPEELLLNLGLSLKVGDVIEPRELSARLVTLGFVAVDSVESAGQFASRGGIIDLFCGDADSPVRIEFFGDEIDRMSYFDPISQRTVGDCDGIKLFPANEVMISAEARERTVSYVEKMLKSATDEVARERLKSELSALRGQVSCDFRDKYIGLIYNTYANLFSYF